MRLLSFPLKQATKLSFCGKSHSVRVGKVKSLGMRVWMDGNGDNREGGREGGADFFSFLRTIEQNRSRKFFFETCAAFPLSFYEPPAAAAAAAGPNHAPFFASHFE